jgi:hypothetical protein
MKRFVFLLTVAGAVGSAALVACGPFIDETPPPSAAVFFAIDAPLCSSIIPVQLSIDHAVVAIDTFIVNVASPAHTQSRAFSVTPGTHLLSARTVAGYVWRDMQVTLSPGSAMTDSLPFYCS